MMKAIAPFGSFGYCKSEDQISASRDQCVARYWRWNLECSCTLGAHYLCNISSMCKLNEIHLESIQFSVENTFETSENIIYFISFHRLKMEHSPTPSIITAEM